MGYKWKGMDPTDRDRAPKLVLFASVDNAGRSQIAEVYFNRLADPEKATAVAVGMHPAARVYPEVVETMREIDADLETRAPRKLTAELARQASLLITTDCLDPTEPIAGLRREDWPGAEPKGASPDVVRAIREDICQRVLALLEAEDWE